MGSGASRPAPADHPRRTQPPARIPAAAYLPARPSLRYGPPADADAAEVVRHTAEAQRIEPGTWPRGRRPMPNRGNLVVLSTSDGLTRYGALQAVGDRAAEMAAWPQTVPAEPCACCVLTVCKIRRGVRPGVPAEGLPPVSPAERCTCDDPRDGFR